MIDYKKTWKEYWKNICIKKFLGFIPYLSLDQIKRELFDYYVVMQEVPTVYCHVTGNTLSKINYPAQTVINKADESYSEMWHDIYKDDILAFIDDTDMSLEEKLDTIREYID